MSANDSDSNFKGGLCLCSDASNRWIVVGLIDGERAAGDLAELPSGTLDLESVRAQQDFARDGRLELRIEAPRGSFRQLVPGIQALLKATGRKRPNWIATTRGPGSFTGTRISVSAARNLAQLWELPVHSVASPQFYLAHEATRHKLPAEQPLAVLLDGKQERVYAARATGLAAKEAAPIIGQIVDRPPAELFAEWTSAAGTQPTQELRIFCDDLPSVLAYPGAADAARSLLQQHNTLTECSLPDAAALWKICARGTAHVRIGDWRDLVPEYLRADPATSKFGPLGPQAQPASEN